MYQIVVWEDGAMFLTGLHNGQVFALVGGGILLVMLLHVLRVRLWGEKRSKEPEKTVMATVTAKEVKQGTQSTGRSNGGYSYAISFLTQTGEPLELYAYEMEFGGLKEGMQGMLTYQGRYFVSFEEK